MDRMNLQEFVRTTLVQLMQGVHEALGETSALAGAAVNPRGEHEHRSEPRAVEFDVAVTVTDTAEGSGKAKLAVVGIEIGGGGGKDVQNQAVSRIRFSVPVSLPSVEMDQYAWRPVYDAHQASRTGAGVTNGRVYAEWANPTRWGIAWRGRSKSSTRVDARSPVISMLCGDGGVAVWKPKT